MITDVFLTVTVIAVAPAAVPKFQLRVAHIRPTADRTPMGVGGSILLWHCVRAGLRPGKLDGSRLLLLLFGEPDSPSPGQKIFNIRTHKQEVVS